MKIVNLPNHTSIFTDRWVSCSKPNSQSRIRFFCFPYAGAGSSLFNIWSTWLLPGVELYLVNLPGRDARIREDLYRQLKPLIEPLTQGLLPHLDKPFVFFGHSMGSLLCFEVARELRRRGLPQPLHLFVSGRQPPHMPDTRPNLHTLPQDEFLVTTQELYGALPEIILQDSELVDLFLSIMRADITMIETYTYAHESAFDFPITVYGGLHDVSVDEARLAAWEHQTAAAFKLKMFPGEHFFVQTERSAVLKELNAELTAVVNRLDGETTT